MLLCYVSDVPRACTFEKRCEPRFHNAPSSSASASLQLFYPVHRTTTLFMLGLEDANGAHLLCMMRFLRPVQEAILVVVKIVLETCTRILANYSKFVHFIIF